jgi:pimeloyl-ACP methyl ester carboxylesterase
VIDRFVCADDGVRLAVRDFGGNGPSLILIHGFFGNLGQYDDFGTMLTDHYRVVAYDQRGHGWSESGPTSISTYLDDLRMVREALHLDDPVIYGGSFGAQVALAYLRAGLVACAFVNEDGQISDWPPEGPGDPPQPDGPRILSAD